MTMLMDFEPSPARWTTPTGETIFLRGWRTLQWADSATFYLTFDDECGRRFCGIVVRKENKPHPEPDAIQAQLDYYLRMT